MEFSKDVSQGLLEAIPWPVLQIDASARVSAANASARSLFGQAILGRHYITALRQPMLLEAIETAFRDDRATEARYLTTEARRDITLLAHCMPVRPEGGLLVSFEDKTATEEAGQIRRDFVANVSHELKTPLTALTGFIETLQGAARDDHETQARFLQIMQKEAGRMNRLVSDLLSLSRVESNERVRPTAMVDLSAIAQSVVGTLGALAAENGVEVSTMGLDTSCVIPADSDQLAQVVTNLLENALKYCGKGKAVTVSIDRVPGHPMIRGEAAVLVVSDTGGGFDPVHTSRLTERFYRIDGHRSRELGGTGLGLAIVKHIVNRHRGRLQIESQPGKGSKFSVILPVSLDLS